MTIFKTKEFENQNIILSKENEIKNKTIENQKLFIYSSIIVLTLITLLTFIVLRSKNKIKTAYNLIKEKNEEISKQAEEIKMMYEQLLELNNFKEGILHMIVHDMKNPLNNLINIEIFKNEQQRIYITKHTSLMMLNLVQDLLDIYKYQDTKMKLQLEDVSAFEIIDNVHRDLILLLDEKSITLQKEITPGLFLHCDKNITSRIFANLLTNAIKYSPLNSQIIIESIPINNFVRFRIIDFGEGIPEKYLNTIFEKFVQLQAKNDKVRSTGLGLTFCKLAVESHGGTIIAKKEEGKGGIFEFTLPLSQKKIDFNTELNFYDKKHFVLTQEEIQLLSQYYERLKETPLYKISAINQIIEEIRNSNNSSQINIWTEKLYMAAISANTKEYDAILSLIKN